MEMYRSLIQVESFNEKSVKLTVPAWDSEKVLQYYFVVMPRELQYEIKNANKYLFSWVNLGADKGNVDAFQIDFGRWQSACLPVELT